MRSSTRIIISWVLQLLALIFIGSLLLASWFSDRAETFSGDVVGYNESLQYYNTDDSDERPWSRHPISSVGAEIKPSKPDYRNTYNFELENEAFTKGLKTALGDDCRLDEMVSVQELRRKDSPWTPESPAHKAPTYIGIDCYKGAVAWLAKKVRRAPALQLPGLDAQPPLQIVHDRWLSYRQKQDGGGEDVLLRVEVLFYRESKAHGKHYEMWIRCNSGGGSASYTVVALELKGVVFEDQIALFPVMGTDAVEIGNMRAWGPPLPLP